MPRKQTPTLGVAITQFLEYRRSKVSTSTFWNDKSTLLKFADYIGPDRKIGNIKPDDVAEWFTDLIDQDVEPSTYNVYRTKIKIFRGWCADQQYVRLDWLDQVPTEKLVPKDWVQLSPDEMLSLLSCERHHPRDRVLLAIAMNTALRINEITKIKIKDVDLWNHRLRVHVSKQKSRRPRIEYPPLTADLETELARWMAFYEEQMGSLEPEWYLAPAKSRDYLGYDSKTRKPRSISSGDLRPTTVITHPQNIARRAFEHAGLEIPQGQAWHVFRRSVARVYFDSMMDEGNTYAHALRRTAALLNHASTVTTEAYLGLSADREARDADLAGKPFLTRLSNKPEQVDTLGAHSAS